MGRRYVFYVGLNRKGTQMKDKINIAIVGVPLVGTLFWLEKYKI
jgi:hypothetical protein